MQQKLGIQSWSFMWWYIRMKIYGYSITMWWCMAIATYTCVFLNQTIMLYTQHQSTKAQVCTILPKLLVLLPDNCTKHGQAGLPLWTTQHHSHYIHSPRKVIVVLHCLSGPLELDPFCSSPCTTSPASRGIRFKFSSLGGRHTILWWHLGLPPL